MHTTNSYTVPRKYQSYPEPVSLNFDEFGVPDSSNVSIIEPIGKPHNHPNTLRGERKKTAPKLNIHSSKFTKGFIPPFLMGESTNSTFESTDVTHSSIITEPVVQSNNQHPAVEHLDLANFKSKPCPLPPQHNHKHCPFYHNSRDYKRPGYMYSSEMCEYAADPETCPMGDKCPKSHNRVEQLYRPDKYKTKFCSHYPNNLSACEYGYFCSFAHSEEDITIELIHNYEYDDDFYMFHYKTSWCPFNLTYHDKAQCVYAHNWQDYRRKPHIAKYDPVACPYWKSTDFILNYESGCPNREKCNKCHGWKEQEYHPLLYKTKICVNKTCSKGGDCPNYHSNSEKRVIHHNLINKVFRIVPRNRMIEGTYKTRKVDSAPSDRELNNQTLNMKQNNTIEQAFSNDDGGLLNSIQTGLAPENLQSDERVCWSNFSWDPIINEKKRSVDLPAAKDWNPRNSFDSIGQLKEGMLNSLMFTPETTKRKWSTNDVEVFSSGSKEFFAQPLHFSAPKNILQIHAKELEDDNDSLVFIRNLEEVEDYDGSVDRSVDADLKRNLERFIDNDEI